MTPNEFKHIPVLLRPVIDGLNIKKNGIYFDGTLGGGGHTRAILDAEPTASVIATDIDDDAISHCTATLSEYSSRLTIIKGSYKHAHEHLSSLGKQIDGALLDLGISSYQVDEPSRGFSYTKDAALDMRMDRSCGETALEIINEYSETDLANIIYNYGEERASRRIAAEIVKRRKTKPIETTLELAQLVKDIVKSNPKHGHPAKKTFQALRIATNGELNGLDTAITKLSELLCTGGRLCVISFHSLEDRIVKNTLKQLATDCVCNKNLPYCVCNHKATLKLIDKIKPDADELSVNKRSQSAILRIAEKI